MFSIVRTMSDCVFCKIVAGEIPSIKIWEDEKFFALLDIFPACKGQALVIPKKHYDSDIFLMDDEVYTALLRASKKVVELMKKGLGVERIGMVVEGLQVPHAHIKLYPFRGGKSFEGGLTGHTMVDIKELQQLADDIIRNS